LVFAWSWLVDGLVRDMGEHYPPHTAHHVGGGGAVVGGDAVRGGRPVANNATP